MYLKDLGEQSPASSSNGKGGDVSGKMAEWSKALCSGFSSFGIPRSLRAWVRTPLLSEEDSVPPKAFWSLEKRTTVGRGRVTADRSNRDGAEDHLHPAVPRSYDAFLLELFKVYVT